MKVTSHNMQSHVMVVVILSLVIILILVPYATVSVSAAIVEFGYANSKDCTGSVLEAGGKTCCWSEDSGVDSIVEKFCQTCRHDEQSQIVVCNNKFRPKAISGGGDLPTLEQIPPNRTLPGGGVGDVPTLEQVPQRTLPGGGVGGIPTLQEQQGEPPLPVVCSEEAGLVKDPETGQCVPIVQPPPSPPRGEDAEQPEEQEEPGGQSSDNGGDEQSEDEGEGDDGSSGDTGNNNDGGN